MFFLILISFRASFGKDGIEINAKYGPEFTFTNQEIIDASTGETDSNNPVNQDYLEKWSETLKKLCRDYKCQVKETKDKHGRAFKVLFKDGNWIQYTSDTEVLEVQTNPQTVAKLKEQRDLLNTFIFDSAKWMGLKPHKQFGGGHVNIDLYSGFKEDPILFRNFLVDQANHPEITYGIFGNDLGNSPPISALNDESIKAFEEVIQEFDENSKLGRDAMVDLRNEIDRRVYTSNPRGWTPTYYQNINLRAVGHFIPWDLRRVEVRGFKPQVSINEYISQAEFLDKRLTYLAQLESPLKVNIPTKDEFKKMSMGEKIKRFKTILKELKYTGDYNKFLYVSSSSCAVVHPMFSLILLIRNKKASKKEAL